MRRMSNNEQILRNWRDAEVVRRPNDRRDIYRGNYGNGPQRNQRNQGLLSRNMFDRDNQRFNNNNGKLSAICMSPVKLPCVPILLNETFTKALRDTGAEKPFIVESIVGENVACAVIRDLVLSSRE
ncbi:hypothetical protein TNCV_4565611 [Trichonephila clavipes]|nr:hypothetical protein TNCV_4565611 [Trichonephila clavipes]